MGRPLTHLCLAWPGRQFLCRGSCPSSWHLLCVHRGAEPDVSWRHEPLPLLALLSGGLQTGQSPGGGEGWGQLAEQVQTVRLGVRAHLRKGASRLMLCQKVDGFRLGSTNTKACCRGGLGSARGFWRVR